jgi:hypothetical protein
MRKPRTRKPKKKKYNQEEEIEEIPIITKKPTK